MKLSLLWLLPLIYLYVTPAFSKDITLDLSRTESNNNIIVTTSKLPRHGYKDIFRPRNWRDSFAVIKYGGRVVPIKRGIKIKETTVYNFNPELLLCIKNPWYKRVFKRGDAAYLYFSTNGYSAWKSITLRQFRHSYLREVCFLMQLDLGKPDEYFKISKNKDGSFTYSKTTNQHYLTQIRYRKVHIWPLKDQIGAIFIDCTIQEIKEGMLLRVRYEDVDKRKKTSYHQSDGRDWRQISNRRGRSLMS